MRVHPGYLLQNISVRQHNVSLVRLNVCIPSMKMLQLLAWSINQLSCSLIQLAHFVPGQVGLVSQVLVQFFVIFVQLSKCLLQFCMHLINGSGCGSSEHLKS